MTNRGSRDTKYKYNNVYNGKIKSREPTRSSEHNNIVLLWRTILLSALSIALIEIFIQQGWRPIYPEGIIIKGAGNLKKKHLNDSTKQIINQSLMEIDPQSIKISLLEDLPIEDAFVRRKMFPPRVEIELQQTKIIASASRKLSTGKENGMLDEKGNWIPIAIAYKLKDLNTTVRVEGWTQIEKERIATILKSREYLGGNLERIIISPQGDLSLGTKNFKLIQLGSEKSILDKQLKTISKLNILLPKKFIENNEAIIDIRDPSKPEIQLP